MEAQRGKDQDTAANRFDMTMVYLVHRLGAHPEGWVQAQDLPSLPPLAAGFGKPPFGAAATPALPPSSPPALCHAQHPVKIDSADSGRP